MTYNHFLSEMIITQHLTKNKNFSHIKGSGSQRIDIEGGEGKLQDKITNLCRQSN